MHSEDKVQDRGTSPLDAGHLAAQTGNDLVLQRDLLNLFAAQSAELMAALRLAEPCVAGDLAHKLNGSARAIGAFELAGAAIDLETARAPEEWKAALEAAAAAHGRALGYIEAYLNELAARPAP
jgi:HPt (histidine-containing phosphotransfer) domain-containing protein